MKCCCGFSTTCTCWAMSPCLINMCPIMCFLYVNTFILQLCYCCSEYIPSPQVLWLETNEVCFEILLVVALWILNRFHCDLVLQVLCQSRLRHILILCLKRPNCWHRHSVVFLLWISWFLCSNPMTRYQGLAMIWCMSDIQYAGNLVYTSHCCVMWWSDYNGCDMLAVGKRSGVIDYVLCDNRMDIIIWTYNTILFVLFEMDNLSIFHYFRIIPYKLPREQIYEILWICTGRVS